MAAIDLYAKKNQQRLIVLVKLPNKKGLLRVKNGKWPDDIEYTYNILKDTAGRIILISQIPYSESGDWFITYSHYFDERGKTFAFRKETNTFDSDIKGGVIFENLTKYYNTDFKIIKQIYTIQDKSGKAIKNNGHINMYQYKYTLFKDVEQCLKAYNITSMQ